MTQLIVALDDMSLSAALELAKRIRDTFGGHPLLWGVKVHEIIVGHDRWMTLLLADRLSVFIDCKIADTPVVSARLARLYSGLGASYITVWHTEGEDRVRIVVEELKGTATEVLAVVALTSKEHCPANVKRLAVDAMSQRAHGVIYPSHVLHHPHSKLHTDRHIVVPGIRLEGEDSGPHVYPLTPQAAMEAGATHIVVGTSIMNSAEPLETIKSILAQLAQKESVHVS